MFIQNLTMCPFLEMGLYRWNYLKWVHTILGWVLNPKASVFIRGDTHTHTRKEATWRHKETQREEGHVKTEAENGVVMPPQTKECQEPPVARIGKEGFSSRDLRESVALLIPWLWTSSLHSCERIHVCCFKPCVGTCGCYCSPRRVIQYLCEFKWIRKPHWANP